MNEELDSGGAEETRTLIENLARYFDPQAFNGEKKSKRNSCAAFRARKLAMSQARAAVRFFAKPGNIERLTRVSQYKQEKANG